MSKNLSIGERNGAKHRAFGGARGFNVR